MGSVSCHQAASRPPDRHRPVLELMGHQGPSDGFVGCLMTRNTTTAPFTTGHHCIQLMLHICTCVPPQYSHQGVDQSLYLRAHVRADEHPYVARITPGQHRYLKPLGRGIRGLGYTPGSGNLQPCPPFFVPHFTGLPTSQRELRGAQINFIPHSEATIPATREVGLLPP